MANKFDMTQIRRACTRLGSVSTKTKRELVTTAAKGFVKDILKFTPPAGKGVTGSAAKKAGEAAIDIDTSLTMEVMSDKELNAQQEFHGGTIITATSLKNKQGETYLEDRNFILRTVSAALQFHMKKRNRSTGRPGVNSKALRNGVRMRQREAGAHNSHVGRSTSDDIALVTKETLEGVRQRLKKQVGILAAGWNASALKLKVSVPSWIKRHPATHGHFIELAESGHFTLTLVNAVPFVGNVKQYEDRLQRVVNYQANKMNRQADFLMKKALREAGWH